MKKLERKIFNALQNGARLQSSEGKNYKTWLIFENGETETIRRDLAESFCEKYEQDLVFGDWNGIYWRKNET
jgi:hypothetical protein